MKTLVREWQEKIGPDSVAYYRQDGFIFIFESSTVCKLAIEKKDLNHYSVVMIKDGKTLKSVDIEGEE